MGLLCLYFIFLVSSTCFGASYGQNIVPEQAIAPSTGGGICGDADTQVTICFPGSRYNATCEYGLSDKNQNAVSQAEPCPDRALFNQTCDSIPGLLFIAYGPCQDQLKLVGSDGSDAYDGAMLSRFQDGRDILSWMDLLGLNDLQQVGGLYLRGYAYQEAQPVEGLEVLPDLAKIGFSHSSGVWGQSTALTVLGVQIPQLTNVVDLGGGLLIQNVPDQNFTGIFGPLKSAKGAIFIAGNTRLTSLAGLENLSSDAIGNLEILSNNNLSNISAIAGIMECDKQGTTATRSRQTLVGSIEVLPKASNGTEHCLLSTIAQVCQFIDTLTCPTGTANAYYRYQTAKVNNEEPPVLSPAPSYPSLAPSQG